MTERYYKKEYNHEYYIFDSEVITEDEFQEKQEYQGYKAFEDSLTSDEIVDELNNLQSELEITQGTNRALIAFIKKEGYTLDEVLEFVELEL